MTFRVKEGPDGRWIVEVARLSLYRHTLEEARAGSQAFTLRTLADHAGHAETMGRR